MLLSSAIQAMRPPQRYVIYVQKKRNFLKLKWSFIMGMEHDFRSFCVHYSSSINLFVGGVSRRIERLQIKFVCCCCLFIGLWYEIEENLITVFCKINQKCHKMNCLLVHQFILIEQWQKIRTGTEWKGQRDGKHIATNPYLWHGWCLHS